jgi:hypothetical protein
LVVKFVKPELAITWATLRPSAGSGVVNDAFDAAFSASEPTTAGSTSGITPRRRGLAGRVGSSQNVGMETTKGLKFCSAATRPRAAVTASAPVPSSVRMLSANESYWYVNVES